MIAQYSRLFRWHVLRYLARHPLLAALNVLTVALGVALYLAIQIANHSANRAFAASVDVVAGRAELEVNAPNDDLADNLFPKIAHQAGISAATPIVRGIVGLPQYPGEYLDLLGIDILTNQSFRTFALTDFQAKGRFDLQQWLRGPRTIAISETFAREHHLNAGDRIEAQVNGRSRQLTIGFFLRNNVAADPHLAAMDIGWAQELLGRVGTLDSVSLRLTKEADPQKVANNLRRQLPPDVTVNPPAQRSEEVAKMLSGFQLNLAAMSLVSLLVGMFLIYNTVEASVVRRQPEIGILRSLGVRRGEVRALFLGEALVLGTLGVALGLGGGYWLARLLVGRVTDTISTLYVLVNVRQLVIGPWIWSSASLLGLTSIVAAAWLPARHAAALNPIEVLHHGTRLEKAVHLSRAWIFASIGLLIFAGVLSLFALRTGPAWLGFGAAFSVLAGFSTLAPVTTRSCSRFLGAFVRQRIEPRLAAQNLGRTLLRNSITIASLAAAVAMTVGVAVMVFSFRQTVGDWIGQTLVADLFIAPAANEIAGPSSFVPREAIDYLKSRPEVEELDTYRGVELPFRNRTIDVAVISGRNRRNLRLRKGHNEEIIPRFYREQCVLISESLARRYHLAEGDVIELPTPGAWQRFPILGVFYDYTRDQGTVFLSAKNYLRFWHDDRVHSVALFLKPSADPERIALDFRRKFGRSGEFVSYSNRVLRTRIFQIFDQTFAVTYVLRTIAVVVAIIGIFLGLTTLVTERSRELGVLRAIGASSWQIRRLLLWEGGMIGLLASALGLVSGICLSLVLTGVINRAFFGWTIRLAFPWWSLVVTPLWIVAAALLAACGPAWRAGRLDLAEAVRSE
ncbi:MAG TPA: FtsX-like permease family protein [Chthoniobacterales bacterium]|nr:FtsX-like permease family protein [Chthoniobacterales bacterium]